MNFANFTLIGVDSAMVHKIITLGALIVVLSLPLPARPDQGNAVQREVIYGWQLMSRQERARYKSDMLLLQTKQERQTYRRRHRQAMQQRAKRLDIKLPPVDTLEDGDADDAMSGHIQR